MEDIRDLAHSLANRAEALIAKLEKLDIEFLAKHPTRGRALRSQAYAICSQLDTAIADLESHALGRTVLKGEPLRVLADQLSETRKSLSTTVDRIIPPN